MESAEVVLIIGSVAAAIVLVVSSFRSSTCCGSRCVTKEEKTRERARISTIVQEHVLEHAASLSPPPSPGEVASNFIDVSMV